MADAWKDDLLQIDNMLWYAWQCVCSLIESFPDPIPSEGLEEAMEDTDMDSSLMGSFPDAILSEGLKDVMEDPDMDISDRSIVWISFLHMFVQALKPLQQTAASTTTSQVMSSNISLRNYYCPCRGLKGAYCSGLMNHLCVLY
jgi:hypothetical protein